MTLTPDHRGPPPRLGTVLGALAGSLRYEDVCTGNHRGLARVLYRRVYCTGADPDTRTDTADPPSGLIARLREVLGPRARVTPWCLAVTGRRAPGTGTVRFYWNLGRSSPVGFVPRAVAVLDELGTPFLLKCVPVPSWRTDRVVLYAPRGAYHDVRAALATPTATLQDGLRPAVPLCTRQLAPGWGTAEDPGDGRSFGEDRCLLLAESLCTAARRRAYTADAFLRVTDEVFTAHGVALARPYLARFSVSDYTE